MLFSATHYIERILQRGADEYFQLASAFGMGMLVLPGALYVLASTCLLFGLSLNVALARLVIIASLAASATAVRASCALQWRLIAACVLVATVLILLVSGLIYDTTIDGQHYHFQAVYALANGWNPYYGEARLGGSLDAIEPTLWVKHYPKSSWIVMAVPVAAGFSFEAAKFLGFAFLLAAASLTASLAHRAGFSAIQSMLIGIAAAANPVALVQLFTRMNDGILGQCLLISIVLLTLWIIYEEKWALIPLTPTIVFAMNLKFSAVPYFAALSACGVAFTFAFKGPRPAIHVGGVLLLCGVLGLCVFGGAPYIQNLVYHGHVFYPLFGGEAVEIMAGNTPPFMEQMSRPAAFFYSLFAETHSGYASVPELKLPLTASFGEIRSAGGPDVRIGGFGPIFSATLVLSLVGAVYLLLTWQIGRNGYVILSCAAVITLISIIFPESWWARYVPQLWLVPVFVAAAAFAARHSRSDMLGYAIVAALLLNATVVLASSIYLARKRHVEVNRQIADLSQRKIPLRIYFDQAQSRIVLMRNGNVSFMLSPKPLQPGCQDILELAAYGPDRHGGQICPQ